MPSNTTRPAHRLRPDAVETLEGRQLNAVLGISGTASFGDPPARRGGIQAVVVEGRVEVDRPIGTVANALLFDEYAPGMPTVFPVTLTPEPDGSYSYSVPLGLSTKVRAGDRDGHQYTVAISVQDRNGSASTSTTISLPGARPAAPKVSARFIKPARMAPR
ncbi:hypothetical protein TA3x_003105 [Tundrisphaera sp. TA3]|uniref:hypothetical protein n=1 Tax=Tundrisphaera sp. TA3 TaxID=3435775 RepID=UPI003EBC641D